MNPSIYDHRSSDIFDGDICYFVDSKPKKNKKGKTLKCWENKGFSKKK